MEFSARPIHPLIKKFWKSEGKNLRGLCIKKGLRVQEWTLMIWKGVVLWGFFYNKCKYRKQLPKSLISSEHRLSFGWKCEICNECFLDIFDFFMWFLYDHSTKKNWERERDATKHCTCMIHVQILSLRASWTLSCWLLGILYIRWNR